MDTLVDKGQLNTLILGLILVMLVLMLLESPFRRFKSRDQQWPSPFPPNSPPSNGPPQAPGWKSWLANLSLFGWMPWARRYKRNHMEQLRLEPTRDHPLTMSVGRGLLSFVDLRNERNLIQQVGWLRKEVHRELGLVLPGVKFSDNLALDAFEYVLCFQGQELARGRIYPSRYLVTGPIQELRMLAEPSWNASHPVTGQPGVWVAADALGLVAGAGFFAYEPLEVVSLHLRHTFWHRSPSFVTAEYTQQFVQGALQMEQSFPNRRQAMDPFVPRLRKVLQSLLELGGDLKDPGSIVRVFETHMKRCESPEAISKRILETRRSELADPVDGSVAGAILYSAHWNEMLCMELFPNMDHQQLSQLTSGLLKMQHYPGPAVERLWNEIGTRSESLVWGRSNQELADQIRYILQRGLERPQPMSVLEKLAILILSFPKSTGPALACQLLEHLNRTQAGELAALLGRYAPLWSEAPLRPDGRNLEIGLRERVVVEFLDWVSYPDFSASVYPAETLKNVVYQSAVNTPEAFCSVLERHYFPTTEPIGHFREMVSAQPKRMLRLMLRFWSKADRRPPAHRRAAYILSSLSPELSRTMQARLRGRGYTLPNGEPAPTPVEVQRALQEYVYYQQSHYGLTKDAKGHSKGLWQ